LTVASSTLGTTVAANSTVTLGALTGSFADSSSSSSTSSSTTYASFSFGARRGRG
jgi:hypothetical protein